MFLALAVIPAAILGFTGHRIRYYSLAASLGFLLLLFGENAQGMAAFLRFLAVACAATFWVRAAGVAVRRPCGSTGWPWRR